MMEDGAVSTGDGRVLGTHLHGFLRQSDGAGFLPAPSGASVESEDTYLRLAEDNLDRLAEAIRENLDMRYLEELVGMA